MGSSPRSALPESPTIPPFHGWERLWDRWDRWDCALGIAPALYAKNHREPYSISSSPILHFHVYQCRILRFRATSACATHLWSLTALGAVIKMLLAPEETVLLDLDDQLHRSACDRCRCQKLRCERPPIGSSAVSRTPNAALPTCRRCQRMGAFCTTSFQQRPGRPRLSSLSNDQRAVGQNQQQSSRVNRRSRNLPRVSARRDSLVSTNTPKDRTAPAGTNRRPCSDAAANPLVPVPDSPQHDP